MSKWNLSILVPSAITAVAIRALGLRNICNRAVAVCQQKVALGSTLAVVAITGFSTLVTGYALGCRSAKEALSSRGAVSISGHSQGSGWEFVKRAKADPDDAVRMRFVHINDVYTMSNVPKLRTLLVDVGRGLPVGNLVASVGGDILSPYPLAALDQGRGMVDVLLQCGFRFACFGNHEADIGLVALRQRIQQWQQGGGVWINTNMPDLLPELALPEQVQVVGYSRNGQVARTVSLLGVCTGDPGLYVAPQDFGGAIATSTSCNASALEAARKQLQAPNTPGQRADTVVVLTHQDTEPDRELANKSKENGISVVLGGHDHEEYLESHRGCIMAKAGQDAHKAVVVDLIWPTPEHPHPIVDHVELLPVSGYSANKPISKIVDSHMSKVVELEKLKGAMALTHFRGKEIISSKRIREKQTTMGHLLCNALREELDVDCVLFDAGNIRGDRDYIPTPGHVRGEHWAFTMADLEAEIPWESDFVTVLMRGDVIAEAVRYSRSRLPELFGGFLQTDDSLATHPDDLSRVVRVAGEALDKDRLYRVAVMRCSLAGMNSNPVFEEWRKRNELPHEDVGRPAKVQLLRHFVRLTWKSLPGFNSMDTKKEGVLDAEEVRRAYLQAHPQEYEDGASALVKNLFAVANCAEDGRLTREEYERLFPLPRWMALTHFEKTPVISSRGCRERQTTMGSLLCNALRRQLAVDCVLFDGGNIRGNRDYIPVPGHHRGELWAFTLADLMRELPWPSELVVVPLRGSEVAAAVRWSRSRTAELFGGFLQVDDKLRVREDDQTEVTHVNVARLEPNRMYNVALIHASLSGMNGNPIFEAWRSCNEVPPKGESASTLLIKQFTNDIWKRMPPFDNMNKDQNELLGWADLEDAALRTFFNDTERDRGDARAIVQRLLIATEQDGTGPVSRDVYERLAQQAASPKKGITSAWAGPERFGDKS